jgi:hypothetical protein
MYLFSMKVFAMKERPVPFFIAQISVYYSVEYISQGTARYNSRVWYKKDQICNNIKIYTCTTIYTTPFPPYSH